MHRILIFRIGHLGDTVVALPAFWAVRNAFPDSEITLLSNSDSRNPNYISARSVLPESDLIDRWETYPTNLGKLWGPFEWIRLLLRLRRRRYDKVFYLMPRNRTQEQINRDVNFFELAGIKKVVGVDFLRKHSLGTQVPNPTPRIERESEFLLRLLANEGIAADTSKNDYLRLTWDESESARHWLKQHTPASARVIAVAPGSKWDSKVWPQDRFIHVVSRLIEKFGVFPIVVGGEEDREKGTRLTNAWRAGANAAGSLSVRESAALLENCDLYLGNDTGVMHLAACVGTPCVAIFAAIDWVGKWEPFGPGHTVFRRAVECEGCHSPVCSNNKKCLDLIRADDVLVACESILAEREKVQDSI